RDRDDRRRHQQGPQQPDAGVRRDARQGQGAPARRLRLGTLEQPRKAGRGTLSTPPVAPRGAGAGADVEVALYEVRRKIYPRAVTGWFAGWRWALVWFTQLIFYGLPWLQWGDRPAVLFDLD